MRAVLTGASGFIGGRLIGRLQQEGYQVRTLGRRPASVPDVEFVRWEAGMDVPVESLEDADAVIHLAGEPVAQRWTSEVKRRILSTRVEGTRRLVSALAKARRQPQILVSASAIGYYGDRGDDDLTESAPPGSDFLAGVCVDWEQEARRAGDLGIRCVIPRIGIVLGREGGALRQMEGPFKAGIGGPAGSGRQWVSWIHADDATELLLFVLREPGLLGPVNATAPEPVRNDEFAHSLGHALHRPSLIPTPAFALKLVFGEMAQAVLASQKVIPEAALRAGFSFRYTRLEAALGQIYA